MTHSWSASLSWQHRLCSLLMHFALETGSCLLMKRMMLCHYQHHPLDRGILNQWASRQFYFYSAFSSSLTKAPKSMSGIAPQQRPYLKFAAMQTTRGGRNWQSSLPASLPQHGQQTKPSTSGFGRRSRNWRATPYLRCNETRGFQRRSLLPGSLGMQ